ncbi:sugar-specific transcriptional regulator TrmB [Halohasta litchfieldiae]|jgi:sugar-specific transcriptional regulator TrmB|uniref:Sugar-specific transcriptional regulator TrmB n=1 Tax=Halohasta litchfieldiae TaxID=1073996 RepID=A0A1H6WIQ7_9EURY|nr:helix-turn-helix domain-containing protein [Halohasta litchfieldiae]ATW87334.1 sugar-specific transcriptional regulator TrmB [Halohasta litchfieldiae]SEJ16901.1 Sugar-specific transcriptional regulator TrmB [Halohasta litchfieldiae]
MTAEQHKAETVSLLQDLGLKEYEAQSFLALTQLTTGTAKEISEISEVPRTRVYDAVRVLESKGLVEVQHSSPQQFRAVSIEEATAILHQQYDTRIDDLQSHLEALDLQPEIDDSDRMQEVWALSDHNAIESRTHTVLEDAESEIVLLVVEEELLTEALYDRLHDAVDRGVDVIVGGETDAIIAKLDTELPSVKAFETELDWLLGPASDDEIAISRLLLVDRTTLLVSSFYPDDDHDESHEQAVFANGLENGIVVLLRRIISSGVLPVATPTR